MLRIWIESVFRLPSGQGLPATVGRRTLITLWSVVLLMFLLVAPVFLGVHLNHELGVSYRVAQVLDGISRAYNDQLTAHTSQNHQLGSAALPLSLAERHGIGALYVSHATSSPKSYFSLSDKTSVLPRTDASYRLFEPWSVKNILSGLSILVSYDDRFVRVIGTPDQEGRQIDVFVSKAHIRADVWRLFVDGGLVVILALIASHFLLRWAIYRSIAQGFTGMIAALYGKQDVSARAEELNARLADNHHAIEMHVAEQARLASLGSAASRLSHDVRNLLASLRLIAERFSAMEDEKSQKLGARMEANIDRALILCDWAIRYKRDKRNEMEVTSLPLAPIIDEALSFVKLHDPRNRVEMVNLVDNNLFFMGERTLIFRVLYNLFLNAVQAMQAQKAGRGFINVSASIDQGYVHIDIVDGGHGMDADQLAVVREICSGQQAGVQTDAVGLGILIAADLTRWHDGQIALIRSDMMGTAFRLSFPVAGPKRNGGEEMIASAI